jgi:hypothetical protein
MVKPIEIDAELIFCELKGPGSPPERRLISSYVIHRPRVDLVEIAYTGPRRSLWWHASLTPQDHHYVVIESGGRMLFDSRALIQHRELPLPSTRRPTQNQQYAMQFAEERRLGPPPL